MVAAPGFSIFRGFFCHISKRHVWYGNEWNTGNAPLFGRKSSFNFIDNKALSLGGWRCPSGPAAGGSLLLTGDIKGALWQFNILVANQVCKYRDT